MQPRSSEANIRSVPLTFGLPDRLHDPLMHLPNVYTRIMCAIYFIQVSQTQDSHLENCKLQFIPRIREAYFRAALAEFSAATEIDIHKLDLADATKKEWVLPLHKLECEEAVLFRELRNLEFHLTAGKLSEAVSRVKIRFKPSDSQTHFHNLKTWILEFDTKKFSSLKNVRNYWSEYDIEKWLHWLNENQRVCGVHRVFGFAIQKYVECITSKYKLVSS